MNLEILYEDNDIILCRKPAGVATQTKRLGQQDMESLLKNYRAKKGEQPYIGVVHRLDQPVEGIMVFAKNPKATAKLSKQIQEHMIGKYYYAVSAFAPAEAEGMLEDYLVTDKKANYTSVVNAVESEKNSVTECVVSVEAPADCKLPADAKKAVLEYKVLERKALECKTLEHKVLERKAPECKKLEHKVLGRKALLSQQGEESQGDMQACDIAVLFDIKLHTGRQHQIRVQMAHMGCPLIGDEKYGRMTAYEDEVAQSGRSGKKEKSQLALCSYRLEFTHPTTGKRMDFSIQPKGRGFEGFHFG